jgi:hypothetical protein
LENNEFERKAQEAADVAETMKKQADLKSANAEATVDAQTGRGQAEQLRALREKLKIAKEYQKQIKNDPLRTDAEKIGAEAKVNDLKKTIADQTEAREKSLREAKEETAELDAQLHHHAGIAEQLRIIHDFEEKILQARKDGDTALAAQLEKQKEIALAIRQKKAARSLADESKLTLGEAAGKYGHGSTRSRAHAAELLEERAKHATGRGDLDRGAWLHSRAEQMKQSIAGLKSSETQSFKDIQAATITVANFNLAETNGGGHKATSGGK